MSDPTTGASTDPQFATTRLAALPLGALAASAAGVPAAGAALGVAASTLLGRGEAGLLSAVVGGAAVLFGSLAAVLAIRPNKPRPIDRWPVVVFGAQGASLVLSGAFAGVLGWWLLYSPPRVDAVVLLGVLPVSWIATWIAVAKLLAASLSPPASSAAPAASPPAGPNERS